MARQNITASELLVGTTQKVFESVGLWSVKLCVDVPTAIEDAAVLGTITFNGAIEGCLAVCCQRECAQALAATILGRDRDEDIWQEEINDIISDVTSRIMTGIKAEEDIFRNVNLSIPTVVHGKEMKHRKLDGADEMMSWLTFFDQHTLELSLSWRQP